jgi:hypothetical protein
MNCRHAYKPLLLGPGVPIPGAFVCEHCGDDAPEEVAKMLEALCD